MDAKVGVITRTKNRPVLLKRAIESVLAQSLEDWIMVIVNDGGQVEPVNNLVNFYAERSHGRIKLIHNERSLGMEAASNIGIRSITTEYLAIHDDDDSWAPEFLTIAISELERAHAQFTHIMGVITMANAVFETILGNTVRIDYIEPYKPWLNSGIINFDWMILENQFAPIQFIYKSEAIEDIGYYNEQLPVLGDWEFNLRFMQKYDIMVVPQFLAFYHHRASTDQSTYGSSIFGIREKHYLYAQLLKNQWLRDDIKGSLGIGFMTSIRSHLHTIIMKEEALAKHIEDIANRLHNIENSSTSQSVIKKKSNSRLVIKLRNFRDLIYFWSTSGEKLHYFNQFIKSLRRSGINGTIRTVKLWLIIKRAK